MEEKEVSDEEETKVSTDENIETPTTSNDSAKRMKTNDSSWLVDAGTNTDEIQTEFDPDCASTSFPRFSSSRSRNYRKQELDSDDSSLDDLPPPPPPPPELSTGSTERDDEYDDWYFEAINSYSSSDDNSSSSPTILNDTDSDPEITDPPVLSKEKPKHKWFMVPQITNRQLGLSSKYNSAELFQRRCYGSLHCVQRLKLMCKLEKHEGCVNSLNFHPNGSLLASGSDDLNIVIWDWPKGKDLIIFDSKHRSNVFQSKFMPLSGDMHIVSCARDGQVRLHQVSKTEGLRSTRRLGLHRGPVHKLSLMNDQPHIVLSAGEDACVISHDVRTNKPTKLLQVQNEERKVPLYSVHSHPISTNEYCVSGRDQYVRVYDQRKNNALLGTYIPGHVDKKAKSVGLHVTCAVYNYNGTEILASYNDDDIYLFDTTAANTSHVHSYQGHRNGATIKGVNFFGPKSEFIVSGSDCGHVYFWDKNSEGIVQWMNADDNGVVNVLEPHPQLPIICTSGLDWDVKVWGPTHHREPLMVGLEDTVRRNSRCRMTEQVRSNSNFNESQVLWMLWRHLRNTERLQRAVNEMTGTTESSPRSAEADLTLSEDSSESELGTSDPDDSEDLVRPISCSPS